MNYDQRWIKWITASVYQWFQNNSSPYTVYLEGMPRATNSQKAFLEIRLNGPRHRRISVESFVLEVQVNIAVQHALDMGDMFGLDKMLGKVVDTLGETLTVYELGDSDATVLGCMNRVKDVRVYRFGTTDTTSRLSLAQVEADYRLVLP